MASSTKVYESSKIYKSVNNSTKKATLKLKVVCSKSISSAGVESTEVSWSLTWVQDTNSYLEPYFGCALSMKVPGTPSPADALEFTNGITPDGWTGTACSYTYGQQSASLYYKTFASGSFTLNEQGPFYVYVNWEGGIAAGSSNSGGNWNDWITIAIPTILDTNAVVNGATVLNSEGLPGNFSGFYDSSDADKNDGGINFTGSLYAWSDPHSYYQIIFHPNAAWAIVANDNRNYKQGQITEDGIRSVTFDVRSRYIRRYHSNIPGNDQVHDISCLYNVASDRLSDTYYERTGYSFTHWWTNWGGGNTYTPGISSTEPQVAAATNATVIPVIDLYATWEANTYEVTYDQQNGASNITQDQVYDSPYNFPPTPSRAGYTFMGWSTQRDGGDIIPEAALYTQAGNQTLYAQWKIASLIRIYNNDAWKYLIPYVYHNDAQKRLVTWIYHDGEWKRG